MQQPNMKMIQQMQNRMTKIQEELEETIVSGSSGGGVVTAEVNGQRSFKSIKIDPSAVDPDDVEMLEDLIVAAVQDALERLLRAVLQSAFQFRERRAEPSATI